MNQTEQLTKHNLNQFTGTEQYFKHWTGALVYTDGVQYLGANGAYWIIDLVASYQTAKFIKNNPFQSWKISRTNKGGFVAICTDGNEKELIKQEGEYTDLLFDIELFCITDPQFKAVLLLTSEY